MQGFRVEKEFTVDGMNAVSRFLSGGEVIATYSYDAFGNLTGQTGEADNSVLYAGSQSDPLSLNLYTYCMNNPERYIDPSGHIAIELAVIVILIENLYFQTFFQSLLYMLPDKRKSGH